jgi:polyisoprenoid-binding protein YceI
MLYCLAILRETPVKEMTMRVRPALLAALVAASPTLARTETYVVDKTHSDAIFTIRHLMSRVTGRFNDVSGTISVDRDKPEGSSVEFTIQTASINTNDEGRDKHLRSADFFDAEKNPQITFKSTKMKSTGKDTYDVTGQFTMRGVTKEITLPVAVLGEMKDGRGTPKIGFETSTTLNRKDYGVSWNRALDAGGYVLADDVKVTITLEAALKKEEAAK